MHRVTVHRTLAIGLAAAAGLALSACGSSGGNSNPLSGGATKGSVVVGSANFPEDELLAEIYAQDLQAHGIKVTRKFNIGARE
ncbi:MAG TPA: glycine betaine ABC transporter substrate-binding protein, partial [Streptosporangiaceae bacterium]